MKFVMLHADYPQEAVDRLYREQPALRNAPWDEQTQAYADDLIGVSDFYSGNLRRMGHDAVDIIVNNWHGQRQWAKEHGVAVPRAWEFRLRRGFVPWICPRPRRWDLNIVSEQIRHYAPDVIFNGTTDGIPSEFLRCWKEHCRLLVGWGEPPALFSTQDWSVYDLVLAPSEQMVDHFRKLGVRAELLRFAFEPAILERAGLDTRVAGPPIRFAGSLGPAHTKRRQLLKVLCDHFGDNLGIWTVDAHELPPSLRARHQGAALGKHFFRVLAGAQVVVNAHIDVAGDYADNMRMFEATGLGRLLVTDAKVNLARVFSVGTEVAAYHAPDDCIETIEYFMARDAEREKLAQAGQRRTLREHTYAQRMEEFVAAAAERS